MTHTHRRARAAYTWLVNSGLFETSIFFFPPHMHVSHNIPIHRISFYWSDSLWHSTSSNVIMYWYKSIFLCTETTCLTLHSNQREKTHSYLSVYLSSTSQKGGGTVVEKCHQTTCPHKVLHFETADGSRSVSFSLLFLIEKYFIPIFPFLLHSFYWWISSEGVVPLPYDVLVFDQ